MNFHGDRSHSFIANKSSVNYFVTLHKRAKKTQIQMIIAPNVMPALNMARKIADDTSKNRGNPHEEDCPDGVIL